MDHLRCKGTDSRNCFNARCYLAQVESDDEGDESGKDLFELPDPSDSESEMDDEMA